MIKRISKIIVVTIALLVLFFSGTYMILLNSEPYRIAKEYNTDSELLFEHVGKLTGQRAAFLGSSVRSSEFDGYAEMMIKIKGERKSGTVYLQMKREVGVWNVVQGNLKLPDGQIVILKDKVLSNKSL